MAYSWVRSKCLLHIINNHIKIYESYDLDIDDMTPEEISRICKYYSNNISKLREISLKKSGGVITISP